MMLSLEEIATVKIAVEVCNNSQLKKEILCVPGSEYDVNKMYGKKSLEKLWNELIERKARVIIENLGVTKMLQEKIIGAVLCVRMQMLTWAEYHANAIGFSRNYSYNFLNSSFFTPRGIVNCKKAAEELMDDASLNIRQKFKLALFCLNEHIPNLYKQMAEEDKQEFYDYQDQSTILQPYFVTFWSYCLKGEVDKLRGETEPKLYWLQMAVESGNKNAVEYCLEQTNLIRDEDALIYAALEAVRNNVKAIDDHIIFCSDLRSVWRDLWVPNRYYTDIMCFLFSKMRQDTQIAFLKKDIEGHGYEENPIWPLGCSRVLEFFLDWPYQDYFLKTARLMWDFLPEKFYVYLIVRFIRKIGCKGGLMYGEEKNYDYKELLWKFLNGIPEPNIRYVFRHHEFDTEYGGTETGNAGSILISHLLQLEVYTRQDKIIIEWILNNATNEEKENIISSKRGKQTCLGLMKVKRWLLIDEFISTCYTSEEKVKKFKRMLSLTEDACHICIDFILNDELKAVKTFIRWSSLPDGEISQLKENMIYSDYGRNACLNTISNDIKFKAVDKVIRWCFLTKESASLFKKVLIFSFEGMYKCINFVISDQIQLANEFTKWSLYSDEDVMQYKKHVATEIGKTVCKKLISDIQIKHTSHGNAVDHTIQFKGGKWKEVESFLKWCFSSEEEISNFKMSLTMKDGRLNHLMEMHLNLMLATKWKEAEILYSWLGLSIGEIRELKKETIFSVYCMKYIYSLIQVIQSINSLDYAEVYWEKINQLLRWCLTNEDDSVEFKIKFDEQYGFKAYSNNGEEISKDERNALKKLYSLIEALLNDLRKQSRKRKRLTEY